MKDRILAALSLGAVCLATTSPAFAAEEAGFQSLFNGKDLGGWDGNPKLWSVKDGAIVGQTTAANVITANTFLIWTNGTTADFEFRCSFRIAANDEKKFANSGIQYRSKVLDAAGWVVGGYQADMEAGPNYTGILYDEKGVAGNRGIMAARGEKVLWDKDCKKQVTGSLGKSEDIQAAIKKEDWNEYVIIAQGNHLQHFINGKPTVDITDECESKAVKSGVLALQLHVGGAMTAEFKNLRLKTLSGGTTASADDLQKLQGTWEIARSEANGTEIASEDSVGITVKIKDGAYEVVKNDSTDRGRFTINPAAEPRTMDVNVETGPVAGRNLKAIYELKDDTLRICYTVEGAERPKAFTTEQDSGHLLITYKRKK